MQPFMKSGHYNHLTASQCFLRSRAGITSILNLTLRIELYA